MMNRQFTLIFGIALLFLWGCNSNQDSINIDYSGLQKSRLKDKPLFEPSNELLSSYIKNGIRLRLGGLDQPIALAEATVNEAGVTTNSSLFSTTNVHELGVDEADRLKYDGEYLYQINQSGYVNSDNSSANAIRILKTNVANAVVEPVSEIVNESDDLSFSDLFLRAEAKQLVAIKNTHYFYWSDFLPDSDWQWNSGKTEIEFYDVNNPESPTEQWKVEIEGNLEGSRRIGNKLYLVTRYVPNIVELDYAAESDEQREANERLIQNTPLSDLLPHYQTNDGAIRALVNASDCLIAQGTEPNEGYADIVTLSAIDLDNNQVVSAVCLNANVQGIYSSTSGFYIGGSASQNWFDFASFTTLHKFDLSNGSIDYKASSFLPGQLGWNDPSSRMSEYQDILRVVTTDYSDSGEPEHRLSLLVEDGSNQLQTLETLPNESHPEKLGKPGEELLAVRFSAERAYLVTFERIDPLYVVDLSDPSNPAIAGELTIPGFSRYLHPLSNEWLLGIGTQVSNGVTEGVKVELYDIRDMNQPTVKDSLVFGDQGSYTESSFDLRAVTLLKMNEQQTRLAIPMTIWNDSSDQSFSQWQESGLFLFEINNIDNQKELLYSGKMIAESVNDNQSYPLNAYAGRSKLHDDAVFYLHGNRFYSSLWENLQSIQGPF